MEKDERVLRLQDQEQRVLVNCLKTCRDEQKRNDISTEELDDLILKVINAPIRRKVRTQDER